MRILRKLRKAKGLSAEEFGRRFDAKESTVYMWERGERTPPLGKAMEIADFLDCRVDELFAPEKCTPSAQAS